MIYAVSFSIAAQGITVSPFAGQIKKHKEDLLYNTPEMSYGIGVKYTFDLPDSPWQHYWARPELSLSTYYLDFGDEEVLGRSISIMPEMAFSALSSPNWKVQAGMGIGIGYLTRKYDILSNPTNNAIGSNINNATKIFLQMNYQLTDRHSIGVGGNLFHFSNGLTKSPNSGINVFALEANYRYTLGPQRQVEEAPLPKNYPDYKRCGIDILYGNGFTQNETPGGPTYRVTFVGVQGYRYLSSYIRLLTGIEYEYNDFRYEFSRNDFLTRKESLKRAQNLIWTVGGEFFFGKYAGRTSIGYYLGYPNSELGESVYFKLSSQYYFLGRERTVNPYIGLLLKSHFASAEYIALQFGVSI